MIKLKRGRTSRGLALIEDSWNGFLRIGAIEEAKSTAEWCTREGVQAKHNQFMVNVPSARSDDRKRIAEFGIRSPSAARQAEAFEAGITTGNDRVFAAIQLIVRAAPLDLPILILGETGTGKELFANLAHARSGRKGSLLAINCAALPADILDAELFGHTKGAYTGAYRDRPGLIEAANDGTLFLDEIGEMTLAVQGRLLRAIEAKEIRRLGENRPRSVSTRFVGATHRDLNQMVKEGSFRADLFFRLKGVIVKLPPLRERPGDVVLLADHFLSQAALRMGRSFELGSDAREKLSDHAWPGNVRELRSVIERAAAMCAPGEPITAEDLDIDWTSVGSTLEEHLEAEERRNILAVLESVDWNQAMAARRLKTKRTTLLGKLKRLGIERPTKRK
jgi:transcriptional regulator with PAS, ATPase and Fis domain